jgi:hypothetical protein
MLFVGPFVVRFNAASDNFCIALAAFALRGGGGLGNCACFIGV